MSVRRGVPVIVAICVLTAVAGQQRLRAQQGSCGVFGDYDEDIWWRPDPHWHAGTEATPPGFTQVEVHDPHDNFHDGWVSQYTHEGAHTTLHLTCD
jgi:hypothetical protein